MLLVHLFPCLSDNYGFLLHDEESRETVCIDTPDGDEYLRQAQLKGWSITQIWNTHWHPDHTGGNASIKLAARCPIVGPQEVERVGPVDKVVIAGDKVTIGSWEADIIDVGGHTAGHIAYYLPDAKLAFIGDSLFPLGCGRMFEGEPDQFWQSLKRIRELPENTRLYSAHEYSQANAKFALHADPDNAALRSYADDIDSKRADGEPTVPSTLARERVTNPFLRADDPDMQNRWGGDTPAQTFAALRSAKDTF